ncbi:hypothetical protein [Mycobacterium sp.]|uniref:hypothetical protein n=1 Tax=Mycobacterium sp. TaxID=1785 RepID=UPI003F99218C
MTVEQTLLPITWDAPLANPAPGGLVNCTSWTEETGATRWIAEGVRVRPHNFGGADSFGVWGSDWCLSPDQLGSGEGDEVKTGSRPDIPDPFTAVTLYAFDSNQCGDLTAASMAEVRQRAAQNFQLMESVALEREFSARLLSDAGIPSDAADLVEAVSLLETAFALSNTVGVIHASPKWQAVAAQSMLLVSSGSVQKTPGGHRWCFGGGYAEGLGDQIVGTSPLYGWRDAVVLRESIEPQTNTFIAIAERNLLVACEANLGAVTITGFFVVGSA